MPERNSPPILPCGPGTGRNCPPSNGSVVEIDAWYASLSDDDKIALASYLAAEIASIDEELR